MGGIGFKKWFLSIATLSERQAPKILGWENSREDCGDFEGEMIYLEIGVITYVVSLSDNHILKPGHSWNSEL